MFAIIPGINSEVFSFTSDKVANLCVVDTPDSDELAGTYLKKYEKTWVTVDATYTFTVSEFGESNYYNPMQYSLSDGTFWLWLSDDTYQIKENLTGAELTYDGSEGWLVKTKRGTRPIKWAN